MKTPEAYLKEARTSLRSADGRPEATPTKIYLKALELQAADYEREMRAYGKWTYENNYRIKRVVSQEDSQEEFLLTQFRATKEKGV